MIQQLLERAVDEYASGRFAECERTCRATLERAPGDEAALTLLAMSLDAQGQVQAAADVFGELARLHPTVPEYRANLGVMLRGLRRFDEADAAFREALSLAPATPDILVNYGLLLLDMGRPGDARHRFLDACELEGHDADARVYAALACIECGDVRRAEELMPPVATWPALEPRLRGDLTKVLVQLGRAEEARVLLESDAHGSMDPTAMVRLASLHERTNRIYEASALLERVRHADHPDTHVDALTLEATLATRRKDYAAARAANEELLRVGDLPLQARAAAHFALASVADKQGQVDEAMAQLAKAHAIQFELAADMAPDIAASAEEPLRIASKWLDPKDAVFPPSADDPAPEASPVFIVGFPRSGTTMLEQMLDAHPRYVSMDERIIVQACVERMERMGHGYPRDLPRLGREELAELRAFYWSEADKVAHRAPGQILVDKNPLNMLRLPMIRRLFPSAKIILALRHPCDVLLSCYMQNFRSPAFLVLCSTLERLAKSYANAMRFWIHHAPLLAPDALVLRYEDTVGDFPAQVERIAGYLDIEERGFLVEFSRHAAAKGYISTPSYSQVIEPVNKRAVARWLPYRKWFEPAFPILRPAADHWGYALPEA
ncbi:MAG: tetratricopeptide repeat protein [Lysobacter sp.]|nr:tetratricopeptide repeat protein [Lysobacter sp.]